MSRKVLALVTALVVVALFAAAIPQTSAREKVQITWFVGLGTGTNLEQVEKENAVVEAFNKSQDAIELVINIAGSNQTAPDALSTLIASGQTPDIVGPQGVTGALQFGDQWLDLQPQIDAAGYSLEQFPENLVAAYRTTESGLTGLPFAVYPGVLYYNADLFDEAGLNYPPAVAGDPYVMPDGTEVPWDYDTVAEIGKILTVDANGVDATSADFDAANIVQYGFIHQWDTIRSDFHTFGPDYVVGADGKVAFPETWRAEAQWLWDSIWTWHITPTDGIISSDLLNSNAFASGKIAMARSMAWYTCCLASMPSKWDIAVQPAYQGTIYAPIDLDTFRISKDTKHPAEAFTVLTYLLGEAALDLTTAYGALPARADLQDAWFQTMATQYPSVTNWTVITDSIALAPNPHHEEGYPNYNKGQVRFGDFRTLIYSDTGGDIDINAEFDKLQADIQTIIDEVE
jgi:multiple sugar transport system substrate-binding protein